jgi:CubicO group peptidase (beta-lactamase class C family)
MSLVEQGRINLDTDISQYLDITLHNTSCMLMTMGHLMNHQGGFDEGLKDVLSADTRNLMSTDD